jgi:hypothetical protein
MRCGLIKKVNQCKSVELLTCWIFLTWYVNDKYGDSYEELYMWRLYWCVPYKCCQEGWMKDTVQYSTLQHWCFIQHRCSNFLQKSVKMKNQMCITEHFLSYCVILTGFMCSSLILGLLAECSSSTCPDSVKFLMLFTAWV